VKEPRVTQQNRKKRKGERDGERCETFRKKDCPGEKGGEGWDESPLQRKEDRGGGLPWVHRNQSCNLGRGI